VPIALNNFRLVAIDGSEGRLDIAAISDFAQSGAKQLIDRLAPPRFLK
jgi:hypothetical protein